MSADPRDEPTTARHEPIGDDRLVALFDAAQAVQQNAYVPYSQFRVGAALRTSSGRVFAGCNVENASYPEGMCAEASAIAAMASAGEREIVDLVTVTDGDTAATCCGGCRQKIREFAVASTRVHAASSNGIEASYSADELLPDSFGPESMP